MPTRELRSMLTPTARIAPGDGGRLAMAQSWTLTAPLLMMQLSLTVVDAPMQAPAGTCVPPELGVGIDGCLRVPEGREAEAGNADRVPDRGPQLSVDDAAHRIEREPQALTAQVGEQMEDRLGLTAGSDDVKPRTSPQPGAVSAIDAVVGDQHLCSFGEANAGRYRDRRTVDSVNVRLRRCRGLVAELESSVTRRTGRPAQRRELLACQLSVDDDDHELVDRDLRALRRERMNYPISPCRQLEDDFEVSNSPARLPP